MRSADKTGDITGAGTGLIDTKEAARMLGRPPSTLERWRCEGRGPAYVKQEGGVRYDLVRLREYILQNTHEPSVRANLAEVSC